MPKILYICYWGAAEQLGQSLVVPAVKRMTELGAEITLVTFEKHSDLLKTDEIARIGKELKDSNIFWIPLKYHKSPRNIATLFDITQGVANGLLKRLTDKKFDVVHARTFVGGLIGMTVAPLIGAKFVYHNEGFYPDEQVDGGVWAENSRPHKVAKYLENKMYQRADGIIALSQRAKKIIENIPEVSKKNTPIAVVPSCVDLNRFYLNENQTVVSQEKLNLVYIGSVGNRYILDKMGAFINTLKGEFPDKKVSFQVYSKASEELITKMLKEGGLSATDWLLEAIEYREMPKRLHEHQAGLFFLTKGISEHGCSPTKIGEYWASGLPVITTPNVSDTDEIIRRERVGIIVEDHSIDSYIKACLDLRELLKDSELSIRCRRAAEKYYSLDIGCQNQIELYENVNKSSAR